MMKPALCTRFFWSMLGRPSAERTNFPPCRTVLILSEIRRSLKFHVSRWMKKGLKHATRIIGHLKKRMMIARGRAKPVGLKKKKRNYTRSANYLRFFTALWIFRTDARWIVIKWRRGAIKARRMSILPRLCLLFMLMSYDICAIGMKIFKLAFIMPVYTALRFISITDVCMFKVFERFYVRSYVVSDWVLIP